MYFKVIYRKAAQLTCNFAFSRRMSTIYSLSSGHGKCGVSVIRVSGPQTRIAIQALLGQKYEPRQRYAHLKAFYDPQTKEMIDKGILLWFPGPFSFTGEDSCEFQVHGSLAVVASMVNALGKVPGLRSATPGEFTKRAFFGGKLDLTEVEGLADLIHAETEAQRKQALLQSTGALSRVYDSWRKRLIQCTAHLEAYIDFAEDENIEDDVINQLTKELRTISTEINTHLNDQRQGEMIRDGVRTVIIGEPNVGKSSFLNLICQRNVSIVTDLAGTTRDIIETTYNFGGYPVIFSDTAGLRTHTRDVIEAEGITRAKECLNNADLVLLIIDAKRLSEHNVDNEGTLENYLKNHIQELGLDFNKISEMKTQIILNKIDLLNSEEMKRLNGLPGVFTISCKEQINMENFLNGLQHLLRKLCGSPSSENPRITHTRYRQQLRKCIEYIDVFLTDYSPDIYPDLAIAAQKLRKAIKCIEQITGHVSTDDILDVVFKDFCIGK